MNLFDNGFWKYFKEISDIPRKSGNEEKIAKYLINFAIERGLKCYTDKYYNVVIWKEASEGYEYKEVLGLQCHTDMICEKKKDSEHNFLKDPIELVIDGDFVKANKTTLGADNGIGVAYILAILDSKKLKTPMLECIFTTQEETTMNGVINLDPSILKSSKIISLDNFREDEMWISSAAAKEWSTIKKIDKVELKASDSMVTYSLKLTHFKGGHSGFDIGEDRGNPIKIIAKLLEKFSTLCISRFEGGSKVNIIPRNCEVEFSINTFEGAKINTLVNEINLLKQKYPYVDIDIEKLETAKKSYNKKDSKEIIDFINEFEHGAIAKDAFGNVILSGNFAAISSRDNCVKFLYSIRYNSNEFGLKLERKIRNVMNQFDVIEEDCTYILGYEQDENSRLINVCDKIYTKNFNSEIKKVRVQACLECGYFADKIPNLQFVAIAPNIYDAHSPSERISIKSANKIWNYISDIVEKI